MIAMALLLIALFGLPGSVDIPAPSPASSSTIAVEEPDAEMKKIVSSVAAIMSKADPVDRALWAEVWTKAAKAVEADETDSGVIWGDTNKLRKFTETALRIGWRRIGGAQKSKYQGLSEEVEKAFGLVLTTRVQPVSKELRANYVRLCRGIAWAGIGKDQ